MKTNLDEIDRRILEILQSDGRITNAELAKRVGLSPPSVLQRVRQLERSGLIRGYHAALDAERLGLRLMAFVMVSLALHQDQPIERFRKSVQELPEVVECYHVSGAFDFLIKVMVRDMRAYELFIREKLTKIKGIQKVETSFVFASPKQSYRVPIES